MFRVVVWSCHCILGRFWSQPILSDGQHGLVLEISIVTSSCVCRNYNSSCGISSGYVCLPRSEWARLTILDSPRALIKQDRMEEARDVMDMLSLEPDSVKRSDAIVSSLGNIQN